MLPDWEYAQSGFFIANLETSDWILCDSDLNGAIKLAPFEMGACYFA
jgi:hypothetical protein